LSAVVELLPVWSLTEAAPARESSRRERDSPKICSGGLIVVENEHFFSLNKRQGGDPLRRNNNHLIGVTVEWM
jgi:hypothetical protein